MSVVVACVVRKKGGLQGYVYYFSLIVVLGIVWRQVRSMENQKKKEKKATNKQNKTKRKTKRKPYACELKGGTTQDNENEKKREIKIETQTRRKSNGV